MQRNKNKNSIFSAVSRGKAVWAKGGKLGKMGTDGLLDDVWVRAA